MIRLLKNSIFCFLSVSVLVSCGKLGKNKSSWNKKEGKSEVTGWHYNDKVQGGTFTMGATQEDVMGDWNNVPRRITINSFFIDKTEVANVHYREYIHWIENVFSDPQYQAVVDGAKPDTLVWRTQLAYNEPYVEYYFRHPSYNYYPVVGVTWKQAHDFCIWRTDRVNELQLIKSGYQNPNVLKTELNGGGAENFNTKSYLMGEYAGIP